jgi:gliding motility-associated protein GldL
MYSLTLFFQTKQGKYIKNVVIGLGASIVLLGALFKIQHWPGAGIMLTIGMSVEAFIFAFLGLTPPPHDYYWERFYPNITEDPEVEAYRKGTTFDATKGKITAGAALDKMLEDAMVTPANIKKLGDNFQRFNTMVSEVRDMSEVTAATNEYSSSARAAATALGEMKNTFVGASQTMSAFNNAVDDTARFHEQVQVLSKNMGALNQIYEVELQDANNHLKNMNKFYSNLVNASEAMASSTSDALAAKDQMSQLTKNLTTLNQIYGSMLAAMQGR